MQEKLEKVFWLSSISKHLAKLFSTNLYNNKVSLWFLQPFSIDIAEKTYTFAVYLYMHIWESWKYGRKKVRNILQKIFRPVMSAPRPRPGPYILYVDQDIKPSGFRPRPKLAGRLVL